jgi:hypothetical protein
MVCKATDVNSTALVKEWSKRASLNIAGCDTWTCLIQHCYTRDQTNEESQAVDEEGREKKFESGGVTRCNERVEQHWP